MIASIGPCLPADLFEATGRYAGPLPWQLDRPTPRADQWLESKFPAWSRSVVEDWADGRFDGYETVVFSRSDDAAQRVYYYLCELQRRGLVGGPRLAILDIAKIPRATSVAHTIGAVRRLAAELVADEQSLERAIVATNERRAELPQAQDAGRTCLLLGTPPAHSGLHEAVAATAFLAVGQTLQETWADPGPPVEVGSGDPVAAIGRQVHARHNDQRGFANEAERIVALAGHTRASAAVLWYTEQDEARVWELPAIRSALDSIGLPLLVLTCRDDTARDGVADEIRTFLEGASA
jgi:hypothetical protein